MREQDLQRHLSDLEHAERLVEVHEDRHLLECAHNTGIRGEQVTGRVHERRVLDHLRWIPVVVLNLDEARERA